MVARETGRKKREYLSPEYCERTQYKKTIIMDKPKTKSYIWL